KVIVDAAVDRVGIQLLQTAGNGADEAVAHRVMVDAHDGRYADGCAGEEGFVADEQLAAVDGAFDDFEAHLAAGELQDGVAGDAFENVVVDGRRDEAMVADHEQVAGGAFGHVAVLVEEDGFVEAGLAGFVCGQGAVDVSAADFGAGGDGVVVDTTPGADARVQAGGAVQVFAEGQSDDGESVLVVGGDADALGG